MYFAPRLNRDCCQRCNVAASCPSDIVLPQKYIMKIERLHAELPLLL